MNKKILKTKMTSVGTVSIPRPVRDRHGFTDETVFTIEEHGSSILLKPHDMVLTPRETNKEMEEIKKAVAEGIRQADAGQVEPIEKIFDEINKKIASLKKNSKS